MISPFDNQVIHGDCITVMQGMPAESIDLAFADPPYNLQLRNPLLRPDQTKVAGVFDEWDKFDSWEAYDAFTLAWLSECRRLLKPDGTLWVMGSYHNIFRIGTVLQNLGFWILNDLVWIKTNPTPNFKGTRFSNAHETLIWAAKSEESRYTFQYHTMKAYNDDLQMRSEWHIPVCKGDERIKLNGQKAHNAQKPEALLHRLLLASSQPGDLVLDPFSGSGTTAAVAKKLNRHCIAIEQDADYVAASRQRLAQTAALPAELTETLAPVQPPKVLFATLVAQEIIPAGTLLYSPDGQHKATVLADGQLRYKRKTGSIHKMSALILQKPAYNGWKFWHIPQGKSLLCIDEFRKQLAADDFLLADDY
ncbi:MAG TPA: DNA methyltransferase [Microscillaceae bacterium]|nr:DNA methyltransferase [Microscillaceae bacterium]